MASTSRRPTPLSSKDYHRDAILKDINDNCRKKFGSEFPKISYDVLEKEILGPVLAGDFDPKVQIRAFGKMLQHTDHYKSQFDALGDKDTQALIKSFLASDDKAVEAALKQGKGFHISSAPRKFSLISALKNFEPFVKNLEPFLPTIYEDEAKTRKMKVVHGTKFQNWGQNIDNVPKYTFIPTTVLGVENLVQYAIKRDFKVRCAGYRHSWAPIFGEDKQILISFLDLHEATTVPDPITINQGDYTGQGVVELKTISLVSGAEAGKQLVRVGAALPSEDFRRWQLANNWALRVDTLLVEVTIGGVVSGLCHGAGLQHKAIPDYVRAIEYVDCKGKKQTVNDPKLLTAAAGNYGLLGVITHVTLELETMVYAVMKPRKIDIGLAVPPINKKDIPEPLRNRHNILDPSANWFDADDASQTLTNAIEDFNHRALTAEYAEWFWCPYQQKGWVQTWESTYDATDLGVYPDVLLTFLEWIEGWIGGVLTSSPFFQVLPGYWQAQLLATSAMAALPPSLGENKEETLKTALPNALHMRRGVQNMRCNNMEFEIPLPPDPIDAAKPDFSICRRLWWDVIGLIYEEAENGNSPMKLTMEMRVMGSSDLLLAPYYGNKNGTCCIGVLSVPKYPDLLEKMLDKESKTQWHDFKQKVADRWFATAAGYKMADGSALNVRPHVAKEWDGLKFSGLPARTYLKNIAFKEQFQKFREVSSEIGKVQGWSLKEMSDTFSNELFDDMVFS